MDALSFSEGKKHQFSHLLEIYILRRSNLHFWKRLSAWIQWMTLKCQPRIIIAWNFLDSKLWFLLIFPTLEMFGAFFLLCYLFCAVVMKVCSCRGFWMWFVSSGPKGTNCKPGMPLLEHSQFQLLRSTVKGGPPPTSTITRENKRWLTKLPKKL